MKFTLLNDGIAPKKGTVGAAAWDLYAPHDIYLLPDTQIMVDTGVIVDLEDPSLHLDIRRRSSSTKIAVEAFPGLIDFDYRGPNDTLKIVLRRYEDQLMTTVRSGPYMLGEELDHPYDSIIMDSDGVHFYTLNRYPLSPPLKALVAKRGDAIAQMVVVKHYDGDMEYVDHKDWLVSQSRGGFGTTNRKVAGGIDWASGDSKCNTIIFDERKVMIGVGENAGAVIYPTSEPGFFEILNKKDE